MWACRTMMTIILRGFDCVILGYIIMLNSPSFHPQRFLMFLSSLIWRIFITSSFGLRRDWFVRSRRQLLLLSCCPCLKTEIWNYITLFVWVNYKYLDYWFLVQYRKASWGFTSGLAWKIFLIRLMLMLLWRI